MEKTEADIAWDELRREVEYRLNLAAAHAKMRKKNEVLPRLQRMFETTLNEGRILTFTEAMEKLGASDWLKSLGRELGA